MSELSQIQKRIVKGTLETQDVQEHMMFMRADLLRQEKDQLEELSDEVYGHVDRRVLDDIQSRIDEINDWLSMLQYV